MSVFLPSTGANGSGSGRCALVVFPLDALNKNNLHLIDPHLRQQPFET